METYEKCRRFFRVIGITVIVYVTFQYLLPLVSPFLLAGVTAMLLRPSVFWVSDRLRFVWKGKIRQISPGIVALVELTLLTAVVGVLIFYGGRLLFGQLYQFAEHLPAWIHRLDIRLTGVCRQMEDVFSMKQDTMVTVAREMIWTLVDTAKAGTMPYLMENSFSVVSGVVNACVLTLVFVIGVILTVQEWEQWKKRIKRTWFCSEFRRVGHLLQKVAHAYIRTQGLIMLLTACICTVGLWFLGNPYSILIGMGVGLLDALPVFGTGTVLIPWTVILCFQRKWLQGLTILGIYVACYLIREFAETKMMGDRVGLSPLETLVSIYVGLQLFGIMGVVLGPVGVLIVREFA